MNIFEFKDKLVSEAKKISNYDDLKYVDKRITIPIIAFIVIGVAVYYYYLFSIYPSHQQEKIQKTIEQARQKAQSEKQYLYSDYSSVRPGTFNNSNSNSSNSGNGSNAQTPSPDIVPAKASKIPANFMDVKKIPVTQKEDYFNAFSIIYDYLEQVNAKNYGNALEYLDSNFKKDNNITFDNLLNYHKNIYFENNTFFINGVEKKDNILVVKLFIGNADNQGVGFNIDYKVNTRSNVYKLIIDDLAKYIKLPQ